MNLEMKSTLKVALYSLTLIQSTVSIFMSGILSLLVLPDCLHLRNILCQIYTVSVCLNNNKLKASIWKSQVCRPFTKSKHHETF